MIFVTGASGFVGKALCRSLADKGKIIRCAVRNHSGPTITDGVQNVQLDLENIKEASDDIFDGVDIVVHAAALTHVMPGADMPKPETYEAINTHGTVELAKLASKKGVRRFVFLSSIKVNGELTEDGKPFVEKVLSAPTDPYGLSKYKAEQALMEIADKTDLEVVIVRPPLVYGPGVKGNFNSLVKLANLGIPLPLGKVNNKRSMVALDNLVDFLCLCADVKNSPKAANRVFLVSDNQDLSISELLTIIARASSKKLLLIPAPVSLMKLVAKMLGKSAVTARLFGNLQVDITAATSDLGWKPVVSVEQQIESMLKQRDS